MDQFQLRDLWTLCLKCILFSAAGTDFLLWEPPRALALACNVLLDLLLALSLVLSLSFCCSQQQSLSASLVSAVTLGYVLTSEDWEPGTSDEREHVTFFFLGLGSLTQCDHIVIFQTIPLPGDYIQLCEPVGTVLVQTTTQAHSH